MSINQTKLIQLASRDIPQCYIATALGISEGRVSQLLDEYKDQIEKQRAAYLSSEIDQLCSLEDIYKQVLRSTRDLAARPNSLGEAVGALERINSLMDRKKGIQKDVDQGVKTVTINIPSFLKTPVSIKLSPNGEMIDIDGRHMAPMPSSMIKEKVDESKLEIEF